MTARWSVARRGLMLTPCAGPSHRPPAWAAATMPAERIIAMGLRELRAALDSGALTSADLVAADLQHRVPRPARRWHPRGAGRQRRGAGAGSRMGCTASVPGKEPPRAMCPWGASRSWPTTISTPWACPTPAGWRSRCRPPMPSWCSGCWTRALSCWARPICWSWPRAMAGTATARSAGKRSTPSTPCVLPMAPAADRLPPWRPGSRRLPWAPTPRAPSGHRPASRARWACALPWAWLAVRASSHVAHGRCGWSHHAQRAGPGYGA